MIPSSRPLGNSGIRLSPIGFGAWAIGGMWGPQQDEVSKAALHRALDAGVTFFDTALVYGMGRSERLIGRVMKSRGVLHRVVIASKVPPMNMSWNHGPNAVISRVYPRHHIVQSVERSLRHLGREYIDVMQLHTWSRNFNSDTTWYEVMARLKQQGKIRAIGISVLHLREDEVLPIIRRGWVDSIQVVYNILSRTPERRLFPEARRKGVGVIVRVPLASGTLSGRFSGGTRLHPSDWRNEWLKGRTLTRVAAWVDQLRPLVIPNRTLAQAALQFVLRHPEVSTVIPGIRSPRQAKENVRALSSPPLTAKDVRLIDRVSRQDRLPPIQT